MDKHSKLIRPSREILLPLLILAAFATLAHLLPTRRMQAQYTVAFQRDARPASEQKTSTEDIGTDPHYRILLENAQVRVFALTLPPGTQSFVRHEHNYLTITLAESELVMWKDEEAPVEHFRVPTGEVHFFFGGSAHGIRNESKAEYRNVTVEFLDPRVTTYGYRYDTGKYDYGPVTVGTPVDTEAHFVNSLDLEKAVARDIQLLPKESLPAAQGSQLLIAVTPLSFSTASDSSMSLGPGKVLWRNAGGAALPSSSAGRTRLAVIEFKAGGVSH
jgi:quercetin dioxygenase-like cupin family protein